MLRVPVDDAKTKDLLKHFYGAVGYDFWTLPQVGKEAEVMVAPQNIKHFLTYLKKNGISHKVHIPDVHK